MNFSNLTMTAVFLTLPSLAFSESPSDRMEAGLKYCDSIAEYADAAFEYRQSGKPKELLLAMVKDSPDMAQIVEKAYEYPLLNDLEKVTEGSTDRFKLIFSKAINVSCKDSVLKQIRGERVNSVGKTEKVEAINLSDHPEKYMIVTRYKNDLELLLVRKLETADQSIGIYAFVYATTLGGWHLADKRVLQGSWWPDTQQFYWSRGAVGSQNNCTFWSPEYWSSKFIHKNMKFGERTISLWTPSGKYTPGRESLNAKSCRKLEIDLNCTRMVRCLEWHDTDSGSSEFYLLNNQDDALYLYNHFRSQIRL